MNSREQMIDQEQARVGKAYRGKDGLIRWITGVSTRRYYQLLWREEADTIWQFGGIAIAKEWPGSIADGVELPAPQMGDTYLKATALGGVRECIVIF